MTLLEAVKKQAEKAREIGLVAEDLLCSCNGFVKMCVWAIDHNTLEELEGMERQWLERV